MRNIINIISLFLATTNVVIGKCDITLYPNIKNSTAISAVSADGIIYYPGFGIITNPPDDLTGSRFLIAGNELFSDIDETDLVGKYYGSITFLNNGTVTEDILSLVLDEGTIATQGITIKPEPEKYVISGGSRKYSGATGTMTITDGVDGSAFCIKVSFSSSSK